MPNPISWSQPLWVFDPINGNDRNSGTSNNSPLKTWRELISRYGSIDNLVLAQRTIFRWLSSQPDSSDPVGLNPILTGGGGYQFEGVPTQVDTATVSSYTSLNTATGTIAQIATNRTGAFWTPYVGMTVHDVTAGAQFMVESDLGNGIAQISAPKAFPVTQFGVDVALSPFDALEIFSLPTIYPSQFDNVNLGDVSGLGASIYELNLSSDFSFMAGSGLSFIECTINGATLLTRRTTDAQAGPTFTSCYFGPGGFGGAPLSGIAGVYGGVLTQPGNNFKDGSVLDGDVLCLLRIHTQGTVKIGRCYWGQTNALDNPPTVYNLLQQTAGAPRLWGPGGLALVNGSRCLISGVTAQNTLLLKGALTVDGSSTAWPWNAGANSFDAAVTVSPANVDLKHGLVNPQTGSGYMFS